jgi:hypothetical protein
MSNIVKDISSIELETLDNIRSSKSANISSPVSSNSKISYSKRDIARFFFSSLAYSISKTVKGF